MLFYKITLLFIKNVFALIIFNEVFMNKEDAKIIFMGTPEISANVLEAIIKDGYQVIAVISQPDKPVGRKGILEKTPTKKVAEQYGIDVYQPRKIRLEYQIIQDLKPDLIITFAYGQIVPKEVLEAPKLGCINLHGSLLPKYRGAAPIQYALINLEKTTGVTLMEMSEEMDAGKMFAKKEFPIDEEDNATSLFNKIAEAAKGLILEILPDFLKGNYPGVKQHESLVTYAHMIKPEEEKLDSQMDIDHLLGWIKALSDEPGGYFYLDDKKLKIFKARIKERNNKTNLGEIVNADKRGLDIQVNGGILSILELQLEGKKKMDYKSFLNGNANLLGKTLK